MKDKDKGWLIKHGRQEGVFSAAGWCLPYPADRTEPAPGDCALSPVSKGSFFRLLLFPLDFIWYHRCTASASKEPL